MKEEAIILRKVCLVNSISQEVQILPISHLEVIDLKPCMVPSLCLNRKSSSQSMTENLANFRPLQTSTPIVRFL